MDSLCENSLCQEASVGNSSMEDITSKKVHFRDKSDKVGKDMLVDSTAELVLSWKDKLLGQSSKANRSGLEEGEDFDLVEWDIQKTIVNGERQSAGGGCGDGDEKTPYSLLWTTIDSESQWWS
ncbi:hypothetical protein Gotri_016138 [Gossypium trilobum]|uniref:Uncharacterized protein n=1 Tax=Gossypium trilobum TaxID=34281 RepID=A0A7J9E2G3_9ROSI|nr:hypothetical protein [Gossypium trilobum]